MSVTGMVFDRTGSDSAISRVYSGIPGLGALFVFLIRRPTWRQRAARAAPAGAAAAGD